MKATIKRSKEFLKIMEAVCYFKPETKMGFTSTGIKLVDIDDGRISLIYGIIHSDFFESYECNEVVTCTDDDGLKFSGEGCIGEAENKTRIKNLNKTEAEWKRSRFAICYLRKMIKFVPYDVRSKAFKNSEINLEFKYKTPMRFSYELKDEDKTIYEIKCYTASRIEEEDDEDY